MLNSELLKMALTVNAALLVSLSVIAASIWWRRHRQASSTAKSSKKESHIQMFPDNWQQVGKVSELYLYPVKSCQGLPVLTAECQKYGMQVDGVRDRVFVVVNTKYRMLTARVYPNMVKIIPSFSNNTLTLQAPQMPAVTVTFPQSKENIQKSRLVTCTIWDEKMEGYDCGDEIAEWLSLYIFDGKKEGARLVYHIAEVSTKPQLKYTEHFPDLKPDDVGVYSDLSGYMMMTEASLADLNSKLEKKVTIRQFRPNIVVSGTEEGFIEDTWQYVKIGDAIFRNSKPCTRCVFTTVDPDKGVKDANSEPLKTLKSYRQFTDPEIRREEGSSPKFGINLGLDVIGCISVGDPVYVGKITKDRL